MKHTFKQIAYYTLWGGLIISLFNACELASTAETPTGDLTFNVFNQGNAPIENARVYLFASEAAYEAYVQDNPTGDPSITPSLTPDNIATTNPQGQVTFVSYELDGPFYSSGTTHFYNPNPIYVRIEGSVNNADFLTNDNGINKLTFPELESGEMIVENSDIFLN